MKYLIGFIVTILFVIVLRILFNYILKLNISEFMIGWASCAAYNITINIYDKNNIHF